MASPDFDDVGTRWFAAMRTGDFEEAWRQTNRIEVERRAREAAGTFLRQAHHLTWSGAGFDGRHVLVRCSHGLGDTLQFIRFVPLAAQARGSRDVADPAAACEERTPLLESGWPKWLSSKRELSSKCATLSFVPVKKLSTQSTSWPSWRSRSQR